MIEIVVYLQASLRHMGLLVWGLFYLLFFFLLVFCIPYLSYIFLFAKEHMSVVKDVLLILHSFPVIYR